MVAAVRRVAARLTRSRQRERALAPLVYQVEGDGERRRLQASEHMPSSALMAAMARAFGLLVVKLRSERLLL